MANKRVIIDIGHGNNTYPPSKGYKGYAEWTFNNAVGRLAKELAELNGFSVYMSQPLNSADTGLNKRTDNINKTTAEVGFSIHANAANNLAVAGHEFWYWGNSENSRKLASLADANAVALLPNKRRGLKISSKQKGKNFAILRSTKMPFILGEFGFFTNDSDRALLQSAQFQRQCAKVVVKSFCDYFGMSFKTITGSKPVEPLKIPQWKVKPLQDLYKDGLVTDYDKWLLELDEPAPNWLVFALMDRINKKK